MEHWSIITDICIETEKGNLPGSAVISEHISQEVQEGNGKEFYNPYLFQRMPEKVEQPPENPNHRRSRV